jgi:hypothetical protein
MVIFHTLENPSYHKTYTTYRNSLRDRPSVLEFYKAFKIGNQRWAYLRLSTHPLVRVWYEQQPFLKKILSK